MHSHFLIQLTLGDSIMIDSLSTCLKESSGVSNCCLFTSSHHGGRRVIQGLRIKCGGSVMSSESVIVCVCVGGGGVTRRVNNGMWVISNGK